ERHAVSVVRRASLANLQPRSTATNCEVTRLLDPMEKALGILALELHAESRRRMRRVKRRQKSVAHPPPFAVVRLGFEWRHGVRVVTRSLLQRHRVRHEAGVGRLDPELFLVPDRLRGWRQPNECAFGDLVVRSRLIDGLAENEMAADLELSKGDATAVGDRRGFLQRP